MRYVLLAGKLIAKTVQEFMEDNCLRIAAALSYYTIFSLPAVLVIVVSIAGFFFDTADVRGRLQTEIRSVAGKAGASQVETMIKHANEGNKGGMGAVGSIVILIFGATGVMTQLQAALNDAWDAEPRFASNAFLYFVTKRLISVAMILGIAFVLVVSLVASTVLTAVNDQVFAWLPEGMSRGGLRFANTGMSLILLLVMFALMYKYLPDVHVPWRGVWLGAAITAVLFTIGKWLLGLYLGHSDLASTYGAAGSLALILVWVYYSGIIFLFGAEFTNVWSKRATLENAETK